MPRVRPRQEHVVTRLEMRWRGARREAAMYRRALEEILDKALERELGERGDDFTHELVERLGKLLRGKRPHGAGL